MRRIPAINPTIYQLTPTPKHKVAVSVGLQRGIYPSIPHTLKAKRGEIAFFCGKKLHPMASLKEKT